MNDSKFRWKDPRTGRVWEVCTCSPADTDGRATGLVLDFQSTDTPRVGHTLPCCDGVARVIGELEDQELALCLDAAVRGGYLWVDTRDAALWWVREREDGRRRTIRFVGSAGELDAPAETSLPPGSPDTLMTLRDRATPATAA